MFAKDSLIWENDQIIKKKIRHKNIFMKKIYIYGNVNKYKN